MNNQNNKVLSLMIKELKDAESIYKPSKFWENLNNLHASYLSEYGIKNFKRSVNSKYFQWGILGIVVHQLTPMLIGMIKGNFAPFFKSKFNKNINFQVGSGIFDFLQRYIYKIYTGSLYEFVNRFDSDRIFEKIEEPLIGNPILVEYKNKLVSQDLCNSIFEYYTIVRNINLPTKAKIAELGAGYGRLGYVLLKIMTNSSYCVIDIPPALFIAQNYLSEIFPKEKIFKFRHFESYQEIKAEFEASRVRFIMPHQIELLPSKYFDLFINISSLHEMTREQISNYINQIDRLCKGYFYSKQWRKSRTSDNRFIREDEYPIPGSWKIIDRRRRHPIQNMFFDTLYKIK